MIKIDEFQREFFDILVETKGFFIEEIGDANASIWIATKTLDSGLTYSIIISDKNNKEKNNRFIQVNLQVGTKTIASTLVDDLGKIISKKQGARGITKGVLSNI